MRAVYRRVKGLLPIEAQSNDEKNNGQLPNVVVLPGMLILLHELAYIIIIEV